jgi:PAS domain S-box-containing protein
MITTVSALVLACAGFVGSDLIRSRQSLQEDVITLADVIGSNSVAALLFRDTQSATQILDALRARPSIVAARLYDAEGKPFVSRVQRGAKMNLPDVAPQPLARFNGRTLEIVRPIMYEREKVGTLYIASDSRELMARLRRYAVVVACILIASILAAVVVSSFLERLLSDPIQRLSSIADRVRREKDYSLRTPEDDRSPREIGALMCAFNDMLAEIESRDAALQRHREDLQVQIEARTTELRTTNAHLVRSKNAAERIAELNESLNRYKQTILDTAGEGIFGLDEHGVATFINPSAARLLNYGVDELIGRRVHDVIHPEGAESVGWAECGVCSSRLEPCVRAGKTAEFLTRDGKRLPIEYTSSTMGGGAGVVVTFRDITERLAVQRMKDEFVSTVSHELRTPLTSIRGALGLLSGGLLGAISDRGQRMLDIAVTNTDRLVRLINDILDLERINSGTVELNRKVATAADIMRDAVDVVQTVADRASVKISFEPDHTVLWVDRDRIVQTLTNLMGNAVKFSPPGSTVRLSGAAVDDSFTFSVVDDGRGIPPEKLERIFDRFQQVDASDSRDKGGSGLGLAICRSIVVAHGGKIWAESGVGNGSAFRFTVPRPAGRDSTYVPEGDRDVVLVCAEEAPSIVRLLQSHGTRTLVVAERNQLMQHALAPNVSAIVYGMASVRGSEIVEQLRTSPQTSAVPLILIAEEPPPQFESYGDHTMAWVRRPFASAELLTALNVTARNAQKQPVLVVEDDEDLARVITMSLESHGLRTMAVATGTQAIAACRRVTPVVVILDVALPDLDGYAVVEWMRNDAQLRDLPLLVYSAGDLSAADQDRLRLGRTMFLTKSRVPFTALEQCVMALLQAESESKEVPGAA